jgi:hypothetical protein
MRYLTVFITFIITLACTEDQKQPYNPTPKLILKEVPVLKGKPLVSGSKFNTFKKVFAKLDQADAHTISDRISETPINTVIYQLKSKGVVLGHAREVRTTTGCNSECLPINYTAFYDKKGNYLKLYSKDGLTKIGHAPFTQDDLIRLSYLLDLAPEEFKAIDHPTELTDILSGATLKKLRPFVVKGAAYSTLRIHLYNQDTLAFIRNLKL